RQNESSHAQPSFCPWLLAVKVRRGPLRDDYQVLSGNEQLQRAAAFTPERIVSSRRAGQRIALAAAQAHGYATAGPVLPGAVRGPLRDPPCHPGTQLGRVVRRTCHGNDPPNSGSLQTRREASLLRSWRVAVGEPRPRIVPDCGKTAGEFPGICLVI